jgi:hypothetical protein
LTDTARVEGQDNDGFIWPANNGDRSRGHGGILPFPRVSLQNASSQIQHDAVLDYYGKRLATCSSDKTIKIFTVEGESQRLQDTLRG